MKVRRRLSKAEAQRIHARERFQRRKNINFTDELHQEAVGRIRHQDPRAHLIEKQSNRASIWSLEIAEVDCCVVYDSKRENIVTVLPERWNADYVQRWWN